MQPPSRRTLLALGLLTGLTALTACTGTDGSPSSPGATPDPDAPVRLRAVAATDAVLAAYDTALAAPGQQAALLQQLRAETVRHRAALAEGLPAAASASPSASTSASTSPAAAPAATPAAEERRAAQAHLADLAAATGPLARLLASVAASRLLHAAALGDATPAAAPASTPGATPTAGATPAAPAGAEGLAALQSALGAEHAAVYGYGIVGARFPEDQQRADARTALAAHEARRDAWQRLLTTLGSTPTPGAGGYRLPFPVQDAATAAQLAAHLETRLTGVYADLVAALPAPHRPAAAAALHETAVRARRWGAPATAFPGIPDPAPSTAPSPTATATP